MATAAIAVASKRAPGAVDSRFRMMTFMRDVAIDTLPW